MLLPWQERSPVFFPDEGIPKLCLFSGDIAGHEGYWWAGFRIPVNFGTLQLCLGDCSTTKTPISANILGCSLSCSYHPRNWHRPCQIDPKTGVGRLLSEKTCTFLGVYVGGRYLYFCVSNCHATLAAASHPRRGALRLPILTFRPGARSSQMKYQNL